MTKSVLLSEDDHLRVTGGDTLTEGATYLLPVVFQRVDLGGGERRPLLTPAGDFDGATFYRRVTLTGPESDKLTLADHAEAWARERGLPVPQRDTDDWRALYEQWHTWAFQGIGDGKQELLQACKALLAAWLGPSSGPADVDKAAELARAAIAKAEG
jgi:hypothetical protein